MYVLLHIYVIKYIRYYTHVVTHQICYYIPTPYYNTWPTSTCKDNNRLDPITIETWDPFGWEGVWIETQLAHLLKSLDK